MTDLADREDLDDGDTPPPPVRSDSHVVLKEPMWRAFTYVPHQGQQLIHQSQARHKVAACGRRFGKSHLGGRELALEAIAGRLSAERLISEGKRKEFWIVGPEYSDSEKEFRVCYNTLKKMELPFDRPGTYNNPESGDMHISLWKGALEIHAKSAKYPNTLVGEGLHGVVLAEAAKMKEKVWTKFLRPTLADFLGWSLSTSTPEGKNWFYQMWKRGQDPYDLSVASWRMPSWTNPFVFPQGRYDPEILDLGRDMSDERFDQEIGASFSDFVGRVFKTFDEEEHVNDCKYDPSLPLYAACDYGWTNPFVWLLIQVDVWGTVYVLDEYRAVNRDINDIADDLAASPINHGVKTLYPDPAGPGDTEVLVKKLRCKADTSTGGELKWRIELIRTYLKAGPDDVVEEAKKPKLFINRKCVGLIREMQDYRYPETKEEQDKERPEKPLDKDDHAPEALGRFFKGYFGGPLDNGARSKVRKAKVG